MIEFGHANLSQYGVAAGGVELAEERHCLAGGRREGQQLRVRQLVQVSHLPIGTDQHVYGESEKADEAHGREGSGWAGPGRMPT